MEFVPCVIVAEQWYGDTKKCHHLEQAKGRISRCLNSIGKWNLEPSHATAKWFGTSTPDASIWHKQWCTNMEALGHKAKAFIMESVQSAIDGILQSSLIPRLNGVQQVILPSSASAKILNGIGKYNAIACLGLTVQDKVSDI